MSKLPKNTNNESRQSLLVLVKKKRVLNKDRNQNTGFITKHIACAAAGLFVSNSGFNRLRISARYLVSNSAESHGYI